MSLRLLTVVYNVYSILAISPFTIKTNKSTLWKKIYSLLTILAMLVGFGMGMRHRRLYRSFIHVKKTICVLIDISLVFFHVYIVLSPNFLKTEQWSNLVENLKQTGAIYAKRSKKTPFYLGFLASQIFYFLVISYSAYAWSFVTYFNYIEAYGIQYAQFYFIYSYNFLLCLIMNIFRSRYKQLSGVFYLNLQKLKLKKKSGQNFSRTLRESHTFVNVLKETINIFNDIFGWPIALICFSNGLIVLNYLDYIVKTAASSMHEEHVRFKLIASDLLIVSTNSVSTGSMIFMSDLISKEAEKILRLALEMRKFVRDEEELKILTQFTNYLLDNFPNVSAARFFVVDRSTILHILGAVVNAVIIMMQIEMSRR